MGGQSKIEKNEFYLFEGGIDGKYPIKMYLEQMFFFVVKEIITDGKQEDLKAGMNTKKMKKRYL